MGRQPGNRSALNFAPIARAVSLVSEELANRQTVVRYAPIGRTNMPKTPSSYPSVATPCDPALPLAAFHFRQHHSPPLTTARFLGGFNVTVWQYQDRSGAKSTQVHLNTTIEELARKFGPAETPDAEVGFHSEMKAGEWFRARSHFKVLQIFSERIPCPNMCGPMLKTYFPGVPWYYYYDKRSWRGPNGNLIKYPAEILKSVYGL